MSRKLAALGVVLVLLGVVAYNSLFIVKETEQALVLQFGEWRRTVQEPGLHLKLPFVQNVETFEKRVLSLDPPVEQVILSDQRRLDVNSFARFRIVDPLEFYQTMRTESVAQERLARTVNAALRRVLGNATQLEVLSIARSDIMNEIRDQVNLEAARFGIEVIDVRIGRADLPRETQQAVFNRMRSEREREAAEFRAQGEEQAQQIRSRAERERTVLIAEAQRDSQILRGEGDGQAIRILADAYGRDEEFFQFHRTLQAYRESLRDDDTTLVLAPTGDFFQFFQSQGTLGRTVPAAVGGQPLPAPMTAPGQAAPDGTAPAGGDAASEGLPVDPGSATDEDGAPLTN